MLDSVNLNDKTYEQLLAEAVAKIPLYSKEWTNFNVSDPGMTVLQNLTAFQLVQQAAIDRVSDEILLGMLRLVGCTPCSDSAAQILVQAPAQGGGILEKGHQLWSGDIPFETLSTRFLQPWGLKAVYACRAGAVRDLTKRIASGRDAVAFPFGQDPQKGDALVWLLSGTPEVGEPIYLWAQVAQEDLRTPFTQKDTLPVIAQVAFEYYTADGWKAAGVRDETAGFLRSGAIELVLGDGAPAAYTIDGQTGCAFRCVLKKGGYDRAPRLKAVAAHLFPMVQKKTTVLCESAYGPRVSLRGRLAKAGYFFVYCRETPDSPYRLFEPKERRPEHDRIWTREETVDGCVLHLHDAVCDAGDAQAVRVVCYDEESVHWRLLGKVYGYDAQRLDLQGMAHVLPDSLLLLLMTQEGEGFFLRPGVEGPDGFLYHFDEQAGQIVIDDPGAGSFLAFLAGCAVTQGRRGNLHACTMLEQRGGYDGTDVLNTFFCPVPGRFGSTLETVAELKERFCKELTECAVAVRAEDYETLVRRVPGLCIHKVKAVVDSEKNEVRIVVKPHAEHERPQLTAAYLSAIRAYLEPYRMLTTRVELCQPQYALVGVRAVVSVKGDAVQIRAKMHDVLKAYLDDLANARSFGETVYFHQVYQLLTQLAYVEMVDELTLYPQNRYAVQQGSDISLRADALCCAGNIEIQVQEYGR